MIEIVESLNNCLRVVFNNCNVYFKTFCRRKNDKFLNQPLNKLCPNFNHIK